MERYPQADLRNVPENLYGFSPEPGLGRATGALWTEGSSPASLPEREPHEQARLLVVRVDIPSHE